MTSFQRAVVLVGLLAFRVGTHAQAQDPNSSKDDGKKAVDVVNKIEAQSTIALLKPPGSRVKKGDLVIELDGSGLKNTLINQEIATSSAEAAYQNARLTREVAEIAVKEYTEGILNQDLKTVEGEISAAKADRQRAKDRLEWAKKMMAKGYVSGSLLTSEKLALKKAILALEQMDTRMTVLEKYTAPKTIQELKSEVEKVRSDELAKELTWRLESARERELRKMIDNYRVVAPIDGRVEYVRPIVAGEVFGPGDVLFRLVPAEKPNDGRK
jgi:multidrug resistance efflux pump